jgi:hypothetical protein
MFFPEFQFKTGFSRIWNLNLMIYNQFDIMDFGPVDNYKGFMAITIILDLFRPIVAWCAHMYIIYHSLMILSLQKSPMNHNV